MSVGGGRCPLAIAGRITYSRLHCLMVARENRLYTPDGKWIYFNSSRTGRMQLWRMKPDGSAQEQVTNDDFNNWFAHISPDGKWIAYIAFPPDIPKDDHPFYKHV